MPEEQPQPQPQSMGMIAMQPLQNGDALVQVGINGVCQINIVIPKPVIQSFLQQYRGMLKSNQEILQAVQNSKLL